MESEEYMNRAGTAEIAEVSILIIIIIIISSSITRHSRRATLMTRIDKQTETERERGGVVPVSLIECFRWQHLLRKI